MIHVARYSPHKITVCKPCGRLFMSVVATFNKAGQQQQPSLVYIANAIRGVAKTATSRHLNIYLFIITP